MQALFYAAEDVRGRTRRARAKPMHGGRADVVATPKERANVAPLFQELICLGALDLPWQWAVWTHCTGHASHLAQQPCRGVRQNLGP